MKQSRFWFILVIITLLTSLGLIGIHSLPVMQSHVSISVAMFLLMIITTIVLYFLGIRSVTGNNPYGFIRLVMVSIFVKILLVLGILVIYIRVVDPENRLFVLPVLGIYLIYSVFETIVLYRIGAAKSTLSNE